MFLTKMPLNPARRGARKLLASPQAMHAAVLAGFPPNAFDTGGRALWRVDQSEKHDVSLLLASPQEPDLTHLVEQAGWQTGQMWQTRNYVPLLERIVAGQRWSFRLTANPVHNVRKDGWSDTKPVGHVTVKQQEQWLIDRAGRLGFSVPDGPENESRFAVTSRNNLVFNKGGHRVTISTATFDGVLDVVDAEAFVSTLTSGVGRAKAYGCGLLTVAPVD